jgi:hypothetical protein
MVPHSAPAIKVDAYKPHMERAFFYATFALAGWPLLCFIGAID